MMQFTEVDSSHIRRVGYDPTTHKLEVEFRTGAAHHYDDVPVSTYDAMMNATSIGKFFHANIKDKHTNRKVR